MSYSLLFSHHRRFILTVAVIASAVVLLVSAFFPLKYSATTRLLIIPKSSLGVDPYTAVKSAERISENLAQIVFTTSFFDRVTRAGFSLDLSAFNNVSEIQKRKLWKKMVAPQVLRGTALLGITVFHADKEQAKNWASAAAYTLQTQGFEYTGGNVDIKIVDTPVLSRWPVKPNFLMNGFLGLVFGSILGMIWVAGKYAK
ncbi:MAG: hypothetical protein AAB849_01430 [Patescibacteria group bacterium]